MKGLVVLGSTGSIGVQTLDVVREMPERFQILGLAAGRNLDLLVNQISEFNPRMVFCADEAKRHRLAGNGDVVPMEEMVAEPDVELVMASTIGTAGLVPTVKALECGKTVALANKEVIIMAGPLIRSLAGTAGRNLMPVDSEPSAIWQSIQGEGGPISRMIITASGGPFRKSSLQDLEKVTPEQALKHPTWNMGRKITIDSATLMNKAFEVIEAHWLFDVPWENIEVVVHPQSIIHSMVEMADGSVKAQMGPPDMRLPIQYSMLYPERLPNRLIPHLDLRSPLDINFEPLDPSRYPCFSLAVEAGRKGGTYPAALSAADEVAVDRFLEGRIGFLDIPRILEEVLAKHTPTGGKSLEEIMEADRTARLDAEAAADSLPNRVLAG
ncbi:MAG: 1-deoxy-D-xylulose-5-phosphate reductoisomerase [Dehalococcoidia bacterium]|nr:1-deoxy-D-xylulose-5-phosphate reductoisomerase [Dehalococcoidia bacterium]